MKHVFTFLFLLLTAFIGVSNAAVRYVKPTAEGNGSGSDWNNASADLQAMINASSAGDEVWVAAGTYMPTTLSGGTASGSGSLGVRDVSFVLKSGVKVYGGFAGNETLLSQRNTVANVTILSGDLGTVNTITDNAYHVVISVNNDANTLLDGVSVTNGYASGSGVVFIDGQTITRNIGAGIFLRGSSLVLNDVKIYNNRSSGSGSGLYIRNSSPSFNNADVSSNSVISSAAGGCLYAIGATDTLTTVTFQNSVFSNNSSGTASGGAGYFSNYVTASFTDVIFSENSGASGGALFSVGASNKNVLNLLRVTFNKNTAATSAGGALWISNYNDAVLNYVNFTENTSGTNGGAMYVTGNAADFTSVQVTNSKFMKNTATGTGSGGGVYLNANVNSTFQDNRFIENESSGAGGGIYAGSTANYIIQSNYFINNKTASAGGGIFLFGSTTINEISNSLFYGNQATSISLGGGGIYVSNGAKPTITNCTLYANSSVFGGGGIGLYSSNTTNATIANCILYGNTSNDATAPDIHKGTNAVLTLTSSLTQVYSTGTGLLIGSNPLFASTNPATGNFLMLNLGSPAIDAGSDAYIAAGVTTDLAGKIRKYNGTTVDMGAFENQGVNPLPVVLSYFTAKAGLNRVELKWQTLSEQNNDYFLIERSVDSKSFTTIIKIAGQGTTANSTNYTAVDNAPLAGTNYYKLKQVDKDGKVTDYDIKAVEFKLSNNLVKIYPNPVVSGTATLQFGSGNYNLAEVINTYGIVVKTIAIQLGATSQSISLNELPQAVYQIRLTGVNVRPTVQRVIKL